MDITILCKVVDNFGDAGFVWRLARRLLELEPELRLFIVTDNREVFLNLAGPEPLWDRIFLFDWNDDAACHNFFAEADGRRLSVILECFQCGRPAWLEKILFEEKLVRTVHVIMIDYLTAEDYAETFHRLKSLTRSAKVQKVNFMPGFTARTGGLILDKCWQELPSRNAEGAILIFVYDRILPGFAASVKAFAQKNGREVLVAQGAGKIPFMRAWGAGGGLRELAFLPQTEWDFLLKSCSVVFVRGEESLSRACLSGIPFVWQAYPQSEDYQLVKVNALLERMRPHFAQEQFELVRSLWIAFNASEATEEERLFARCTAFLERADSLAAGFGSFAQSLRKNGDLASNLMTFIEKITIMKE